jgi:hypothetical protein
MVKCFAEYPVSYAGEIKTDRSEGTVGPASCRSPQWSAKMTPLLILRTQTRASAAAN